jgi:hypothetical protein
MRKSNSQVPPVSVNIGKHWSRKISFELLNKIKFARNQNVIDLSGMVNAKTIT